ncbi:hypothetical protein BGX29_003314 [Mortierella sp. GBA35]|nr:hypothetical protein BGX29_003314 [Mortierella sp. GBA35]
MSENTEPDLEHTLVPTSTPESPTPGPTPDVATMTTTPDPAAQSAQSAPSQTTATSASLDSGSPPSTEATAGTTPQVDQTPTRYTPVVTPWDYGYEDEADDKDENNDGDSELILPVDLAVVPAQVLENIPDEIWCLLLSFVPPAKLITLTRVCRRWKLMIEQDLVAAYWKPLAIQTGILNPADNHGSGVGEMPMGFIKMFPELVLGHTLVICELCLTRSKRGCGSAIPLPVDRRDPIGRVWMCRPCRRDYYDLHPEPERALKPDDKASLYGLPGYPPMISRSTGPPRPRTFYSRGWGRGYGGYRDYYSDDFDSMDEFESSEGEYGSDWSCYATEEALLEDDRWNREADLREAVEKAMITARTADCHEAMEVIEMLDMEALAEVLKQILASSVDTPALSTKDEDEPEDEDAEEDAEEDEGEEDEEEEEEVEEVDEEMHDDESDRYDDDDEEEEEGEECESDSEEPVGPEDKEIIKQAREHHGGDIGIDTHNGTNATLNIRLKPLRNRLMRTRLGVLGLNLRADSKLCTDYLNGLMDDPFKIAEVMKQMQWYFAATAYKEYCEDSESSVAKSAAMEQWVEETIATHGENAKNAYRCLDEDQDPAEAIVNLMDAEQPPKALWPVLDEFIDHQLKGDKTYTPPPGTFTVQVGTDDLQD